MICDGSSVSVVPETTKERLVSYVYCSSPLLPNSTRRMLKTAALNRLHKDGVRGQAKPSFSANKKLREKHQ